MNWIIFAFSCFILIWVVVYFSFLYAKLRRITRIDERIKEPVAKYLCQSLVILAALTLIWGLLSGFWIWYGA